MYCLSWSDALRSGSAEAGGKGWNLSRLVRYGFPVPEGGVLAARAYHRFLAAPALQDLIAGVAGVDAGHAASAVASRRLRKLQQMIRQTPLPPDVERDLRRFLEAHGLSDRPVAVRSSATAEDSARASFAGIHESVLNVTGPEAIIEAVKRSYASLWSPRAVGYRRKLGLSDDEVAAAVVILAMVPARAAGVGFSCDPRTGRKDRFHIAATLGLGEALVGGRVEPDEFLLDITQYPPVVVEQRLGRREQITVARPGGGTGLAPAPEEASGRPVLTDVQLHELAYLVGRVQDALGEMQQPQDVEWAHDGERFWLLQARPVTGLPPATFPEIKNQPTVWSNANLKDVMPGVQSTLGWSFMRSGIEVLLSAPLLAGGYHYPGGLDWVRLFSGRAYFNLAAIQWAMYDAFGIPPAETNRIIGGHQPEIQVPPPTPSDWLRRRMAMLRLTVRTVRVMREMEGDFRRLWDWAEKAEQEPMASWSRARFLEQMLRVKAQMEAFLPRFQLINAAAGGAHQELVRALEPAFGGRAGGLANAMLAGLSGVTSAEQGERLIQLGNDALREERARAYFTDPNWDPKAWAERLHGTRFKQAFEAYLRDYGHRAVYELEPLNPRWKEDPTYLLETVRSQVLSGKEIALKDRAEKREAARREVFRRLGFTPRALRVQYFLGLAARAAALREMAKSVVVKVAGISRYAALAVGRRMAAEGLLEQPEDVFHLSWIDLEAYLLDRPGTEGFKALVADRKALRERHLQEEPSDVIIGERAAPRATPAAVPKGRVLSGLGVATGRAAGPARVIRHPSEGGRLQPGDVLVAPSTDPAWTPLFLRAAAIVMEVGGSLSHGAIVAREYGLPAVVNIPGLLRTVRDGELLTVDGDEGKVYRGNHG